MEHKVSICFRAAGWMFKKLCRDEVLMAPLLWLDFSANPAQGWIQGGQKYVNEGSLLQMTAISDMKATGKKRMHSNDLKACRKKG